MAGAPEQQPPTLIERMLAWSLARWDGYEELERHALRSAIASGRAAINAGHSTAAAASNLVGNIQELSEERAMEGAAQCKALAQRAHHEYPECVIAAATLAGAVTGGSRLSAAASGGLATVAVASSFGRKWALPPESYAWIVEAHGSATKELGKAVRMTMAGARSHKDKMVATAYSSLGSINKVVSIMEDSMRSEYRKLCTAYHGLVRQYPERLVALSYAMGLGYLSAQNGSLLLGRFKFRIAMGYALAVAWAVRAHLANKWGSNVLSTSKSLSDAAKKAAHAGVTYKTQDRPGLQ